MPGFLILRERPDVDRRARVLARCPHAVRGPRLQSMQRAPEAAPSERGVDRAPQVVGRHVVADDPFDAGCGDDPTVDLDEDDVVDRVGALRGVHLDLEVLAPLAATGSPSCAFAAMSSSDSRARSRRRRAKNRA